MQSEVEKQSSSERSKRKYQEKIRLREKVWTYVEVCRVVSKWVGGSLEEKYLEYTTLWKWLDIRGKKEEKEIEKMMVTEGGIKLSLEYLRRVHDDQMEDYTTKDLRECCGVKMDDYLLWSESELAEFVFRCEQLVETERMQRQTHIVRKQMIKGIKEGDNKKIQQWLEMTGRDKAERGDVERFTMKVVDKYVVNSDEAVPGEVKIIPFKGPTNESVDTGQQETSTNLQ